MSNKANPAIVGAFVVGAIALAVCGVLVFGSGRLFQDTARFVLFFPGAVDGLNVGAPVKFKGVQIGSVTDIRLRLGEVPGIDAETVAKGIRIPVVIEVDNNRIIGRGAAGSLSSRTQVEQLIDLGLRAQLGAQSLVTGLLFIQLDFMPEQPATFALPRDSSLMEIPTVPTTLEQVQSVAVSVIRKLEQMDLKEFVDTGREALSGLNQLVNAPGLHKTVQELPKVVARVDEAVASLRQLTVRLGEAQGPLLDSLKTASDETRETLDQARETLRAVEAAVGPESTLSAQLSTTLEEFATAARAVRLLADYLERNPGALVRGKGGAE